MAVDSKRNLIYVVIRNIFFIAVLIVLYQYVYLFFKTQLDNNIALYGKFSGVYDDLLRFAKMNDDMQETRAHIQDIIDSIPSLDYVANQDLLTGYRDRVIAVAEKYSIKNATETVVKDDKTGMVTLTLKFQSKYEPLYKFLFDIEMFSKVHSFSIDKDKNMEVQSSPILYGTVVNDYFNGRYETKDEVAAAGYFKEIFKKSAAKANNMGHIPTWRDIDPAPADPFYEYIPPKKVGIVTKKVVVKRKPPPIEISGIIFDPVNPIAIIDGKIYRVGDFYKNNNIAVKIVSIQERTITVELDGQKYIIKFNKEG